MRLRERIPIFIEKVDLQKVVEILFLDQLIDVRVKILTKINENWDTIVKEWKENPDWRFTQALVNTGTIPNISGMWYYIEDHDLLKEQGVPLREILHWGRNFDKDMQRLPETQWILIKDLKTDHIEAILNGKFTGNVLYLQTFKEELELRKEST